MTWTIQARTSGSDNTYRREPNADALAYFFDVCDRGAPGRYTMRSERNAVLARAIQEDGPMSERVFRSAEDVARAFFPESVREREALERQRREDRAWEQACRDAAPLCSERGHHRGVVPCSACVMECMRGRR